MLGEDWVIVAGGTSRNVCKETCAPLLIGRNLQLSGPIFRSMPDKTRFRLFWSSDG